MNCRNKLLWLLSFCYLFSSIFADELTIDPPIIWQIDAPACLNPSLFLLPTEESVIIDLCDPLYEEGILSTQKGGVLNAPDLRIQAQNITYTRNLEGEHPVFTVVCEGNLLIDYKQWTLVGDYLFYDFAAHRGFLINGRTAASPWYIGGKEILLTEEGTLVILDGFMTTSEGEIEDVVLRTPHLTLFPDKTIQARHVNIRVNQVPIFWLPTLRLNLNTIGRSPFAVRYGWGGFIGSYISLLYRILSWNELEATARIDAFFGKGLGGGIETAYNPISRPTQFYTRNYYAHDIPLDDPHRRDRYRFQGTYFDSFYDTTINGMYDFVSDGQMAADYQTKDFDLQTAGRTQIECRKKMDAWIGNLFARVRVNDFQSVNQELPTLHFNLHPFEIPHTGIIFENTFRTSYLDYVFSNAVINAPQNFSAGRIAAYPALYRPITLGPFIATPEVSCIAIAYSNSPGGGSAGQALGECGIKLETALCRPISSWRHVMEPYLHYHYLTTPRVAPDRHFIFSINDGLDRLNQLRFGLRNSFFSQIPSPILRPLSIEIWANAFFSTPTIRSIIPRGYLNLEWQPHPLLFCSVESGWNFEHQQLDFCNARIHWTFHAHAACSIEYRHRGRYDWRKADFYNFILESVRTENELLASPLSDRRETLLFRLFTRLNPDWSMQCDVRHGWHRKWQHSYLEYQIEMTRVIYQHWRLTVNFEKREADNRFSFALLLDPGPP